MTLARSLLLLAFLTLPATAAADPLFGVDTGQGSVGVAAGTGCTGVEYHTGPPLYRYFCYGIYTAPNGFVCVGMFTYDGYRATCSSVIPTVPDVTRLLEGTGDTDSAALGAPTLLLA